ncbi:MAG: nucleotidyltransferase [Chlorobi bacterium]|nr:nucleotidyltransferase [Chlorobiota bacterium]
MESLNYYLTKISKDLFIKNQSFEREKIKKSVNAIIEKLEIHFDDKIEDVIKFGSYTRGTILPRKYDENSDVDVMVMFNTSKHPEKTAETYRNNLMKFAEKYYPRSISYKDLPSVIIELRNIKFDLVPAVIIRRWFTDNIYIPDSKNTWQRTDPDGFNEILINANKKFSSIVKPIIRLLKYWNSQNAYPYDSYFFEQEIANMNFKGDSVETGFYYAIEHLGFSRNDSNEFRAKLNRLKSNKNKVIKLLEKGDKGKAKSQLHKIIPNIYLK